MLKKPMRPSAQRTFIAYLVKFSTLIVDYENSRQAGGMLDRAKFVCLSCTLSEGMICMLIEVTMNMDEIIMSKAEETHPAPVNVLIL